ncbi:MAG TPA: asparagine synthase-related protein [Allosphingosinicella sp.]|nr:asparagine synthase-related protein [Allosphingosinicella sp.]
MSAVAGYWAFESGLDGPARCEAMLAAQRLYGPDDTRSAQAGGLALGRNLFRLLPEDSHDVQPLSDPLGRYALVADLRLDNREEIAAALDVAPRHRERAADSHILFLALQRWGEAALDRILGDFAFAFFDSAARKLLLARDPLGQRPLFYHRGKGFLAFSSMPRGIHAAGVERRPALDAAARYLALLYPRGPQSWFEGIERVEPGHVVTLTADSNRSRRFWTPERRELRLGRFEDYVEAFRAELDASVARRLRGAGPVTAAHLSGGWDSGAVTATAARLLARDGGKLVAFTAVPARASPPPPRRFSDEGPLAAQVAAGYPNVEHVLVESSGRSPLVDFDRYVRLFERPPFNPCNHVWLAQIRAAARERGARVLLTGEIGNWTISAGPVSILADLVGSGRLLAWGREAFALAAGGRARVRGIAASSFGPWLPAPLWRGLSGLSSAPSVSLQSALRREYWQTLAGEQSGFSLGVARPPKSCFAAAQAAFCDMDLGEYRKGVLGGWGIDKRDATADRRLIEFCLSLPLDMLMKKGERRPLARAALADRLPLAVLQEHRKGYQASDWHIGLTRALPEINVLIEEIAADPEASSLVDVERLRSLVHAWPDRDWETPETIASYRVALLQGLAAGHFILAARG